MASGPPVKPDKRSGTASKLFDEHGGCMDFLPKRSCMRISHRENLFDTQDIFDGLL
jgi:hypothetical protein